MQTHMNDTQATYRQNEDSRGRTLMTIHVSVALHAYVWVSAFTASCISPLCPAAPFASECVFHSYLDSWPPSSCARSLPSTHHWRCSSPVDRLGTSENLSYTHTHTHTHITYTRIHTYINTHAREECMHAHYLNSFNEMQTLPSLSGRYTLVTLVVLLLPTMLVLVARAGHWVLCIWPVGGIVDDDVDDDGVDDNRLSSSSSWARRVSWSIWRSTGMERK
jgi:hypothetical protein